MCYNGFMPKTRTSGIFDRILSPTRGDLAPDLARYVLSLDFSEEDKARYDELSVKAQRGELSKSEASELDELLSANSFLMVLQSKARISLSQKKPAA